ncbi:5-formyltetrahydrofolate cyclo-ligase, partial [Brucella suis]
DRALARFAERGLQPLLIGMAFDCQEVDYVPNEPHDIALHQILTESGLRSRAMD